MSNGGCATLNPKSCESPFGNESPGSGIMGLDCRSQTTEVECRIVFDYFESGFKIVKIANSEIQNRDAYFIEIQNNQKHKR